MKVVKTLTWNELAKIYNEQTGKHASTKPMDRIFKWATKRPDLFTVTKDGRLIKTKKEGK